MNGNDIATPTITTSDRSRLLDPPVVGTHAEPPSDAAPPPRGRVAWRAVGGVLAVATLVWGTFNVVSLLAHEEYETVVDTFDAATITSIDVATEHGSITVRGVDTGSAVSVSTDVSEGIRPTEVTQRVVDGVLVLRGRCPALSSPWCRADFTVEVPADRPVRIDGSEGSVVVEGLTGPVRVDNDNGSIDLVDLAGDVEVTNDNGRIVGRRLRAPTLRTDNDNGTIDLTFAEPPTSVTATNDNGSITVSIPDGDALYRVDLDAGNGSVRNDVRTDPASDRVIDLRSGNGSVRVLPTG